MPYNSNGAYVENIKKSRTFTHQMNSITMRGALALTVEKRNVKRNDVKDLASISICQILSKGVVEPIVILMKFLPKTINSLHLSTTTNYRCWCSKRFPFLNYFLKESATFEG